MPRESNEVPPEVIEAASVVVPWLEETYPLEVPRLTDARREDLPTWYAEQAGIHRVIAHLKSLYTDELE